MVLSPWAVRELRFDESLGTALHGYDFDYCLQARERGRKVVTADFRVIHHHSLNLIGDVPSWIEAHIKIAEKWDGRMPGVGAGAGDWQKRARRAEAEASAARTQAGGLRLVRDLTAKALQEETTRRRALERELAELKKSKSWRVTAPLRWLGDGVRRRTPVGRRRGTVAPAPAQRPLDAKPSSSDGRPASSQREPSSKL
jgi:hypothetical protein